jgi:hypothetical protein
MSDSQQDQYLNPHSGHRFFLFGLAQGNRTFILLIALVMQIVLSPLDSRGSWVPDILQAIITVAAVLMAADSKRHLQIGLGFAVPSVLLLLLHEFIVNPTVLWSGYLFLVLLYCFIIFLLLDKIFKAQVITINVIGMALCTYLLLGTLWVLFYLPLLSYDPGAFNFPSPIEPGTRSTTLQYFSYVTLTTLGYGDVYPINPWARALAVLEALTGTLFLAVLISRLVGSYSSSRK